MDLLLPNLVTEELYQEFLDTNELSDKCTNQEFNNLSRKAEDVVKYYAKHCICKETMVLAICMYIYNYATDVQGEDDETASDDAVYKFLSAKGLLKSQG